MGRPPRPGGPHPNGMSLWINAESYQLLLHLAKLEERPVQTLIKRAIGDYAENSPDFQRWLKRGNKRGKDEAPAAEPAPRGRRAPAAAAAAP